MDSSPSWLGMWHYLTVPCMQTNTHDEKGKADMSSPVTCAHAAVLPQALPNPEQVDDDHEGCQQGAQHNGGYPCA